MKHIVTIACATLTLLLDVSPVAAQPARDVVVSGGYVMSLDPDVGDLTRGDILIRDGAIAEIAPQIAAPGVERIDVRGKVVMPGLIDAHSHLWTSSMKGWFQNTGGSEYFKAKPHYARYYTARDIRISTYYGAVETLSSGITTTVDFFHNNRNAAFFDANLQALRDSGVRAQLLYGPHDDLAAGKTVDLDRLGKLARDWRDQRVTLGFGWRSLDGSPEVLATGRRELAFVRKLGLPISVHAVGKTNQPLAESGLLGTDVQVVHATGATPQQLTTFEKAGASLALTPVTEQRVGYGLIELRDFAPIHTIGFGVDGPSLAGSADLFATMRLLALNTAGSAKDEKAIAPRRLLEMATLDAARSIDMADRIGSIKVGKRADLIVIDLQALNLAPLPQGDPAALIVYSAQPANVELVMVDGIVRKRDGRMLDVDVPQLLNDVRQSIAGIVSRAGGLPVPAK